MASAVNREKWLDGTLFSPITVEKAMGIESQEGPGNKEPEQSFTVGNPCGFPRTLGGGHGAPDGSVCIPCTHGLPGSQGPWVSGVPILLGGRGPRSPILTSCSPMRMLSSLPFQRISQKGG